MADIDLTTAPYFDLYDPASNYTMLLFNPDRPLQQRELNEMQSITSFYMKQLANSTMRDGDIQDGMEYTQDGNDITVANGTVYVAGKVRAFPKQTVTITGTGMETIGVKISQVVVTSADDSSLNDPTQNVVSTGSAGADRLQETVTLVANDSTAATIYQFSNGVLYHTNLNTELSRVQDIMARRTFATNGNYRVGSTTGNETGFAMSLVANKDNPAKVDLIIQPGYAFVQGYEVQKPYPTTITIDKSSTYENISSEQHVFHTGVNSYQLAFPNVRVVNKVSAQVQQTFTVNHKAKDGQDFVVDNMTSVDKVATEGSAGRTYVEGTDFVVSGNSVDWAAPTGQEPAVNTSYSVTATYNKVLTGGGVDYTATVSTDVNGLTTIDFSGAKGSGNTPAFTPKDTGYITIDYDAYLYRIDSVYLDKDGNFTVHTGVPARKDVVSAPEVNDPLTLQIGTVTLYPHSDQGYVLTSPVTNMTMEKLNKMLNRVINLEYNEIINSLDNQTIQEHSPMNLRGVFTDAFVTMDKFDGSYDNRDTATDGFKANVMFSFDDGSITLPKDAEDPHQANLIGDSSTAHTWGRLVSAPFTEFPVVQQLQATEFMSVVPYGNNKCEGTLTITPGEDNWIEESHITVNQEDTFMYDTGRWWNHPSANVSGGTTQAYYNKNVDWDAAGQQMIATDLANAKKHGNRTTGKTIHGTITQAGGTQVTDVQIQYMRPQTITFSAQGLKPNQDNLVMRFANIIVNITPASGYKQGSSVAGSIMADSTGAAAGTFEIPSNVLCGKVQVMLDSDLSTATTTYVAEGINKVTEDTIIKTYVTANLTDPLAESFQTLDARQLTGVNLWFGSKSTTDSVNVQLRGMSDTGLPTTTVYASQVLTPDQVMTSDDASVVTQVRFDDPVMTTPGQSMAIVIASDSGDYTLATATTDSVIMGTDRKLQGQAYQAGVLFKSSNGATWSPAQNSDLKFEVMAAKFNPTATMEFDPFKNLKLDEFILMTSYLTPDNTGCTWEYRIKTSATDGDITTQPWLPLSSFTLTDAQGVASEVQLRATFSANEYISPLMSLNDLQFGAFTTALRGDYVSLAVPMDDSPFNTITLNYPVNLPGKSSVTPQYSLDNGQTWLNFKSTPTSTQQSADWTNIEYIEKLDSTAKTFKLHFQLETPQPYQRPRIDQVTVALTNE